MLKQTLKRIFGSKFKYQPLIKVLVFANRLKSNYRLFSREYPKFKFAPVLKSNAYGHGLMEVAEILKNEAVPFFVIDSFYEALTLRQKGIKTALLVVGFASLEQVQKNRLKNVAYTVTSLEYLRQLSANRKNAISIHLKIDTGMHRQGILPEETGQAVQLLKRNREIKLEGVCSHLADADGPNDVFTRQQIGIWNRVVKVFKQDFPGIRYFHLSATAGAKYMGEIDANVARLGIGLYGFGDLAGLQPALEMKTIITSVKAIQTGESVGYNLTFKTERPIKIATIPVGYYEGLDRRLSNIGKVKIKGFDCPIIGRVSMNITTLDITSVLQAKNGDEAVVIGSEPRAENSVANIAAVCKTIPYEILVRIPQHLRREVING